MYGAYLAYTWQLCFRFYRSGCYLQSGSRVVSVTPVDVCYRVSISARDVAFNADDTYFVFMCRLFVENVVHLMCTGGSYYVPFSGQYYY